MTRKSRHRKPQGLKAVAREGFFTKISDTVKKFGVYDVRLRSNGPITESELLRWAEEQGFGTDRRGADKEGNQVIRLGLLRKAA